MARSERITYERGRGPGKAYSVHSWGVYERGSVLAGQPRKRWLDSFETEAEVLAAYPKATPNSRWTEPRVSLNHLPGTGDGSWDY
jgi:hypothetical protein